MPITDVLIIGSGIAGLSAAIKIARHLPERRICVLTKGGGDESNTTHAQGGIAVVSDPVNDSFEKHIQDTLDAGDGLCDPEIVRKVIYGAPERLRELIETGVEFDRGSAGELHLAREGGHHANRIVHCRDTTGMKIISGLLARMETFPNITLLSDHVATDLITVKVKGESTNACYGAYVLNVAATSIEKYISRITVLATGGVGQLYQITTNPSIATGDGIAMAYRAGATISNMEFVQFHPTALADPEASPAFLVSEAVRGNGAYLRNEKGDRFMFRYHKDGELACRDIVSRAIATERQSGERHSVYLDCTHMADLREKFPGIYKTCLSKGLDLNINPVPVVPAAHYLCGGISVDVHARTCIRNLYAIGECSNTGLHGANRLASNSLSEAMVFAHACYLDVTKHLAGIFIPASVLEAGKNHSSVLADLHHLSLIKLSLKRILTECAGIVRTTDGLNYAFNEFSSMKDRLCCIRETCVSSRQWYELRNMVDVALLIVSQSLDRKENRGVFFNSDLEYKPKETVGLNRK